MSDTLEYLGYIAVHSGPFPTSKRFYAWLTLLCMLQIISNALIIAQNTIKYWDGHDDHSDGIEYKSVIPLE